MLAAEKSGAFQYSDNQTERPSNASETETISDRLEELMISKTDSDTVTTAKLAATPVLEKATKLASSSRPLTVDDDDLDIDLEIDDNIDTTVSSAIPLFLVFLHKDIFHNSFNIAPSAWNILISSSNFFISLINTLNFYLGYIVRSFIEYITKRERVYSCKSDSRSNCLKFWPYCLKLWDIRLVLIVIDLKLLLRELFKLYLELDEFFI